MRGRGSRGTAFSFCAIREMTCLLTVRAGGANSYFMTLSRWNIVNEVLHLGKRLLRRAAAWFVLLAIGGLSVSCLQADCALSLNADGSGVFECRYIYHPTHAAVMRNAAKVFNLGDFAEMIAIATADDQAWEPYFKELEPQGVRLRNVKSEQAGDVITRRFAVTFRSLNGLEHAGFLAGQHLTLMRNAFGQYTLLYRLSSEAMALMEAADELGASPLGETWTAGWLVKLTVAPPGRILKSNAETAQTRAATWRFVDQRNMPLTETLRRINVFLLFEGKGLALPEYRGPNDAATGRTGIESI